jgi:energy-coupling factor transporter ATP-binding protein EcfA2
MSCEQTLLGHLRVLSDSPVVSEDGIFPFCGHDADPYSLIASVSFSHRSGRSSGGAFYDYTARYGAIRDEDSLTLRESMFPESIPEEKPDPLASSPFEKPKVIKRAFDEVVKLSEEDRQLFEDLVKEMDLEKLLDLPLIALSNGQTRRARIVRTVLRKPELMLLDEPLSMSSYLPCSLVSLITTLAGLDIASRPKLLHLLHNLHQTRRPRVILGLRTRDDIPEWITHIALVQDGTVKAGAKGAIVPLIKDKRDFWPTHDASAPSAPGAQTRGEIVLDLKNVNVKYSDRVVGSAVFPCLFTSPVLTLSGNRFSTT